MLVSKEVKANPRKLKYQITKEMCLDINRWSIDNNAATRQRYIREERERKIKELLG